MIGGIVSTVGLLMIVVTLVSAERRSKRRTRDLCERADRQLETFTRNAAERYRERFGREPTQPGGKP
jgi:hypothetical protein